MGAGEESSPAKHPKPASTQEAQVPPPSYADWSNSMQAYYGGTPPFFASTVPSPTPHPYMWGGQHPMMSPYGTPAPYPALYPPAGVYAHPSIPMTPNTAPPNAETEIKTYEGKERTTNKKSKGTSGNGNARTGESGKEASSSGNDNATQSAESGSDGSSDGSDNNDQHEYSGGKKGSFNQMLADANAQNNNSGSNAHTAVTGNPVVSMAGTNLNMGMDLWNPSAASGAMKMRPNPSRTAVPSPMMGRDGMMPDQWGQQDERELKRQKRKQSNRESARRSRLRKQAECEELQARVEVLSSENNSLRDELQRLSEECEKLTSENNSIKDELTRVCGPEAVSQLDEGNS
ncbi:G-box-binding factor 1-like isoform X1 [Rutidosis leptorrhynchoides]|uniref:G-box-binding factor 1-like isoform X1 n=1 Tax=Rutidosis leptorrhynchoides TaxID=125765 RepID=UPI003A9A2C75